MRRLRWAVRNGKTRTLDDGTVLRARGFGLKLGYWPCLRGPFVELAFNTRRYALWIGLPSYEVSGER